MKKGKPDYFLIGIVAALLVIGILVLASVSAPLSREKSGKTTYYFFHQLIYGLLPGFALGLLAFKINLSFLKKWAWVLILINLIAMALVFIPGWGIVAGGAPRWLRLGFISFQPSEFLKISFILYLSTWLTALIEKQKISALVPFLIVIAVVSLFLTLQSDVSTLAVIILVGALMYFSAGTPLWHNLLLIFLCALGLLGLIKIAPYRLKRILVFLNPGLDPMGIGYQVKQILIAIGSGGIFGLGLGMSGQQFGFIPQTMSDSIFAIFSEETGFIGSLILISLFLILLWRGLRLAKKSKDKFSQLFSLGLSCWLCLQAFVNIGAMLGVLPLTGIPLPFISYGGSHLIAELTGIGILLNISKNT